MVMGKSTPPKRVKELLIIQFRGLPRLKTIMKLADIIPRLLKARMVKMRTKRAAGILGLIMLTPKKNTPSKI
ncbi:hypothetical protein ES703_91066 [subsurface metagenome]